MTKTLAVANQKGGVGKTTTAVNLAASLAATGKRVVLVDCDPQGNATSGSGVDKFALQNSLAEVLLGQCSTNNALLDLEKTAYRLLPANESLTAAEIEIMSRDQREFRLRHALAPLRQHYDFILLDCPPALSMLTVNAMVAASGVLIPIQCEYYALEGLTSLNNTIDRIRQTVNPDLHVEGILRTMYDPRNNLALDVSRQLQKHFARLVYDTIIPRNVTLAEAPSHGLPVLQYDKSARGARAYIMLAGELLRRNAQRQGRSQDG